MRFLGLRVLAGCDTSGSATGAATAGIAQGGRRDSGYRPERTARQRVGTMR